MANIVSETNVDLDLERRLTTGVACGTLERRSTDGSAFDQRVGETQEGRQPA